MTRNFDPNDIAFKQWVKGLLHDKHIKNLRIAFTKSDGTEREIHCTLYEGAIPLEKAPKGTGRATSDATQRVFDLEKQEWRSFKWENVIGIKCDF